jgi:Leucine-rich repeat (LRR) protein
VEHLVKLENLEYLDLSNNLIKEVARLCPLKRVKDLTVCLVGNPFLKNDGWKPLLDSFHFTVEKQARDFAADTKPKQ